MNLNEYYDYIIDMGIASEETLRVITDINGYSEETLDDVLYCQTTYRDLEQYMCYCDKENYNIYFSEDDEDEEDEEDIDEDDE